MSWKQKKCICLNPKAKLQHKSSSAYIGGGQYGCKLLRLNNLIAAVNCLASLLLLCRRATRAAEDTQLMKYKLSLKLWMN